MCRGGSVTAWARQHAGTWPLGWWLSGRYDVVFASRIWLLQGAGGGGFYQGRRDSSCEAKGTTRKVPTGVGAARAVYWLLRIACSGHEWLPFSGVDLSAQASDRCFRPEQIVRRRRGEG